MEEQMNRVTRRTVVSAMGAGGAAVALGGVTVTGADAQAPAQPPWRPHEPKPLPFNPARLEGLSERLITSHWQNNYTGSVNALNMIEGRLAAALDDPDFPPLVYGGLKREQLHRTGSVVLHELYFGNLGGNGAAGSNIQRALAGAFGSFERWETDFRRTATSLAGGSGWCVLAFNTHTGELGNYWMWDHMHAPAASIPLLALDMYEHSYHMDYGTAAARYIDAFMRNLNWEEVERRHEAVGRLRGA
jgi:Fe-Mn family superoxide dismutase